ncbi:MAG: dockerin type I repeat-containing protein [Patescibacteria group bacterium]
MTVILVGSSAHAQQYSSSNYTVEDPVMSFPGGYSTSPSFGLSSVISQMSIGSSTAASFKDFAGFLYFPFVSTPAVSATAGSAQVALTWTSADASGGWAVSGYNVGQATVSGGPYTFASVGNVLSSTRTGLANGTAYYFVVQVVDALGNTIATSTQVSATPVASTGGTNNSGGGGGGGGGGNPGAGFETGAGSGVVRFSGRAYPGSKVTLLKDAQVVLTSQAGPDSNFDLSLMGLSAGTYSFSLYSSDTSARRSTPITIPVTLSTGAATHISGLFLSPTISVDKAEVKKGDDIAIFGQSVGASEVTIQVNSDQPYFAKAKADGGGVYLYNFDTTPLEMGNHSTKSKSATSTEISPYSAAVGFIVGTKNVKAEIPKSSSRTDFNGNGKVNLVDFSILLYWYKKSSPPAAQDLNHDSKVDLVDFSILAYEWTG